MTGTEPRPCFVYILECADGTLYTGVAYDVEKRVAAHNKGRGAKYTRGRRPVKLRYSKEFPSWLYAAREEARIKRLTREEKEKLICS